MRVGEFELNEPLPGLRNPHVIASLTPWIDAGSVGSLSLERLERFMGAEKSSNNTAELQGFIEAMLWIISED